MALRRIVSGAQTGADRAALEAARAAGIPTGGWVPKGRWAEDGPVPEGLGELRETESADPAERTRRNVADSDATLILSHGALRGGSELTREEAARLGKPCLWLDLAQLPHELAALRVLSWLEQHAIGVLNVAGPRASEDAEIYQGAFALVSAVLARRRPKPALP
jgi:putative molybdenum carrier protein